MGELFQKQWDLTIAKKQFTKNMPLKHTRTPQTCHGIVVVISLLSEVHPPMTDLPHDLWQNETQS